MSREPQIQSSNPSYRQLYFTIVAQLLKDGNTTNVEQIYEKIKKKYPEAQSSLTNPTFPNLSFFNYFLYLLKSFYSIDLKSVIIADKLRGYDARDHAEGGMLFEDFKKSFLSYIRDHLIKTLEITQNSANPESSIKRLTFNFLTTSKHKLNFDSFDAISKQKKQYQFRSNNLSISTGQTDTARPKDANYESIKECLKEAIKVAKKYGDKIYKPSDQDSSLYRAPFTTLATDELRDKFFNKFLLAVMSFADVNSGVSNKPEKLQSFVDAFIKNSTHSNQLIRGYAIKNHKLVDDKLRETLINMAKLFSSRFQKLAKGMGLKTGRDYAPGKEPTFEQMVGLRLHRVAQGPIIFDVFKDVMIKNIHTAHRPSVEKIESELFDDILANKKLAEQLSSGRGKLQQTIAKLPGGDASASADLARDEVRLGGATKRSELRRQLPAINESQEIAELRAVLGKILTDRPQVLPSQKSHVHTGVAVRPPLPSLAPAPRPLQPSANSGLTSYSTEGCRRLRHLVDEYGRTPHATSSGYIALPDATYIKDLQESSPRAKAREARVNFPVNHSAQDVHSFAFSIPSAQQPSAQYSPPQAPLGERFRAEYPMRGGAYNVVHKDGNSREQAHRAEAFNDPSQFASRLPQFLPPLSPMEKFPPLEEILKSGRREIRPDPQTLAPGSDIRPYPLNIQPSHLRGQPRQALDYTNGMASRRGC